tara:strand:+ start:317 stop:502 length:186 start_codon:yes stop_codon:yes gene_type:complete
MIMIIAATMKHRRSVLMMLRYQCSRCEEYKWRTDGKYTSKRNVCGKCCRLKKEKKIKEAIK